MSEDHKARPALAVAAAATALGRATAGMGSAIRVAIGVQSAPSAVREVLIRALHDAEHTGCTHELSAGERHYYGVKADDLWAELAPLVTLVGSGPDGASS